MGDDGWVTVKPYDDDISKQVEKLDNDVANKLSVTASDDRESVASSDSQNDVENGNANDDKDDVKKRKSGGALNFFKRMGPKDSGEGDKLPSLSKARRTSQIPMELKVESLPQVFITKYLGTEVCTGLWGIQHTHGPVTTLVDNVGKMKKDEDLPLVQLKVSNKGIQIAMHPENKGKLMEEGLIPVEFISYGVQDIKFTRVFSFILVKEMSWRAKKMEVHAYVCDSTASCRRLSLSVALAFKEYAATLGGQPYKFHVDLRPPTELEKDLDDPEAEA